MRIIDLGEGKTDLTEAIKLARLEPVLLVTSDGKEFCLADADDFEKEVEVLRESPAFLRFLNERSAKGRSIPFEDLVAETEKDLEK